MQINIWGILLLTLLVAAATGVFWLIDRRTLHLVGRSCLIALVQLLLVGGYVWGLYALDSWWADALWVVLMALATAAFALRNAHLGWNQRLLPTTVAVLLTLAVMGGVLLLCFKGRWFVPVMGLLAGQLLVSTTCLLRAYESSLLHTRDHRLFLLANGATPLESLVPSIRRALRAALLPLLKQWTSPVVVAMPALFCGLLMGGVAPLTALAATLIMLAASLAATVLAGILTLTLTEVQKQWAAKKK